ncbi:sensor histidine kinase [Enteractinococcus fodinae]|uniref:histidine kinase n=1 Tax=Enteractinococcus fodinae TaxID=684663 RepID=A0ABU2AXN0_9MICC|nr:histidine kinase [Enteractinococcus fodinae]MDR7346109.1 signal transduction histidine kinase [Enteractinococcus fodinae]
MSSTTQTQRVAETKPARPPLRLGMTLLHLAVLGTIGWAIIGLLFGAIGLGAGLIIVLGLGLIVLLGVFYALFGIAWFEIERVASLYDIPAQRLTWRSHPQRGFVGYLKSLGRNIAHGRMWAALGNFLLACLLGSLMMAAIQAMVRLLISAFAPLTEAETVTTAFGIEIQASYAPWLILLALLCAGVVVGVLFLHRTLATAIIGATARESKLTEQVRTTTVQREGAMRAAEVERTRIERDLHDGVQPRLVSVGMTLGLAKQEIDNNPAHAKELVDEAHTSTKAAITELRQLTRGIYASVLDDRGLDAALSAVAGRSHIPVNLDVRLPHRCGRAAEAAVYFAIAEGLTNAAKHSRASEARVTVRMREDDSGRAYMWARVEDNGTGGAKVLPGGGLDGITNRTVAAGGTITVDSPAGGPTALEVSVPCAS